MHDTDTETTGEPRKQRPWIGLNTTYDAEAWIDSYNRDLQRAIEKTNATGYGICFHLAEGGEIFMHTTPDGDILLDVTPEAEWAAPVLSAATGIDTPGTQIWALPGHTLTQFILGLNSLIASTSVVVSHDFRMKKY